MPSVELQDELVWVLQPRQYAYVRQQNQLVEARYSLTARELKLVLYVCAMVDPDAQTFGKCQIRVKEFAELAGVDSDNLYMELRDTARAVRSKELILENVVEPGEERPRRKYISWFIDVSVDPNGDGYIGVTLHPDLKPYLLQVHRDYTRFQLGYAVRMESKYAIRLYQLLQRWAFVGKKRIPLDELRLRLGARELDKNGEITKDSLPAYKNLKQKALTPALDEINEKSDISVSYTEEKQKGSKAIAALNFRIRKNLETAGKFDEVKLPRKSQMELPLEQMSLSAEHQAEIARISVEFALNAKRTEALADYISRDGIAYVLEKAEIVRSEPRQNAAEPLLPRYAMIGKSRQPSGWGRGKPRNRRRSTRQLGGNFCWPNIQARACRRYFGTCRKAFKRSVGTRAVRSLLNGELSASLSFYGLLICPQHLEKSYL